MDEISCPNCKTTKYRKSDLVLLVNVCGHSLCDNCVGRIFLKGAGECPECKITLRRANFKVQQFEDSFVDKECDIRRKVLAIYNRKESDFDSLRAYNDYLEEVETVIYNLSNGIDVEETKMKMERYKEMNKDTIVHNRHKLSKDEALLEQLIEEEREMHELSQQMAIEEEQRSRKQKQKQRDDLIDNLVVTSKVEGAYAWKARGMLNPCDKICLPDCPGIIAVMNECHKLAFHQIAHKMMSIFIFSRLSRAKARQMFSDLPANRILENHRRETVSMMDTGTQQLPVPSKPNKFSSGVSIGVSRDAVSMKKVENAVPLYVHKSLSFDLMGPKPPSSVELISNKYLRHVRSATVSEMAGGYQSIISCQRALQDAFCGLCFVPSDGVSVHCN